MQAAHRLALSALFATALAACGGGGGDAGAPAGAGGAGANPPASASGGAAPAPSPSASPAPSPSPSAQAFSAFDPFVVGSGPSNTHAPAVARLAGGGNVVFWVEGRQLLGRLTDAAGSPRGGAFVVDDGDPRVPGSFSAAAAPDGGFIVVWAVETEQPQSQFHAVSAIQARLYSASAEALWETRVNDGLFHTIGKPVVKAAGEAFVVGWTSRFVLQAPDQAFLQRLAPDGSRSGGQVAIDADRSSTPQEHLSLAPLQDGSTFAVWRQRSFADNNYTFYARRFGPDLVPLTGSTAFPGFPASTGFPVEVAALADGNVAAAWGASGNSTRPEIRTAVFTPDAALVSGVQASEVLEFVPSDVAVVSFGPAGYGVAWQVLRHGSRQTNADITLWRLDAAGSPLGAPQDIENRLTYWVSPTTGFFVDAGTGFDLDGGADGHYVLSFHRADGEQANTYLAGR